MRYKFLLAVALLVMGGVSDAQTINRKAILTWTAPTVCEGGGALTNCPILGYSIQKQSGTSWAEVGSTVANILTFTHENLPLGTHTYRVLATSAAGPSAPSAPGSKSFAVPGAPGNLVITVTITIE